MTSGEGKNSALRHRAFDVIVLQDDVFFQHLDGINFVGSASFRQHHFAETSLSENFNEIKIFKTNFLSRKVLIFRSNTKSRKVRLGCKKKLSPFNLKKIVIILKNTKKINKKLITSSRIIRACSHFVFHFFLCKNPQFKLLLHIGFYVITGTVGFAGDGCAWLLVLHCCLKINKKCEIKILKSHQTKKTNILKDKLFIERSTRLNTLISLDFDKILVYKIILGSRWLTR